MMHLRRLLIRHPFDAAKFAKYTAACTAVCLRRDCRLSGRFSLMGEHGACLSLRS